MPLGTYVSPPKLFYVLAYSSERDTLPYHVHTTYIPRSCVISTCFIPSLGRVGEDVVHTSSRVGPPTSSTQSNPGIPSAGYDAQTRIVSETRGDGY